MKNNNMKNKKYTVKKRNKYKGGAIVQQKPPENHSSGLTPEAKEIKKIFSSTNDPNTKLWIKTMFDKYLSIGTQAFTNATEAGSNNLAKMLGVDPNKPLAESLDVVSGDVEKNTGQLVNAFNSPKAQKSLANIRKLTEKFIETAKPAINKSADILKDLIEKESVALSNAGLNAIGVIPGLGEAVEFLRVAAAAGSAANKAIDATNAVISTVSDVAPELSKDAVAIGNNVSDLSKVGAEMPSPPPKSNPSKNGGGSGFKMVQKYQTGGRKTMKRINNSINEFLNSSVKHKLTKSNKKI
jgi:ATP-dependent protease HslVU (ClpYQ) peptidase subunit